MSLANPEQDQKDFNCLLALRLLTLIWIAAAADSLRISPVLLKRAQDVSKEHAEISERLANTFDGKLARRSAEISATATALQAWEKASKVSGAAWRGYFSLSFSHHLRDILKSVTINRN